MLMCAQTHGCAYVQPHTPTRTYARIRAREGIFLTTKLLYNIAKPSSIISPTSFTSIIQSLYNPYLYWHHHRNNINTLFVQTVIICHSFSTNLPFISNYLPTIQSSLAHIQFIFHLLISLHHLARIIFHLYLISSPTNHPINMSVCYKTLSILYILSALPYTAVSHLI